MLTLTRRRGESISIGTDIEVTVLSVSGNRVRIGIRAPRHMAIYRGELVERIIEENRRAVTVTSFAPDAYADEKLMFPEGLFGMREHREFLLCEVGEAGNCRALVSCSDPTVSLLVVDATEIWPDYPIESARQAAGIEETDIAVAAVLTAPADGSPATVNLAAPIVIAMGSRQGRQVILEEEGLGVRHLMVPKAMEATG